MRALLSGFLHTIWTILWPIRKILAGIRWVVLGSSFFWAFGLVFPTHLFLRLWLERKGFVYLRQPSYEEESWTRRVVFTTKFHTLWEKTDERLAKEAQYLQPS